MRIPLGTYRMPSGIFYKHLPIYINGYYPTHLQIIAWYTRQDQRFYLRSMTEGSEPAPFPCIITQIFETLRNAIRDYPEDPSLGSRENPFPVGMETSDLLGLLQQGYQICQTLIWKSYVMMAAGYGQIPSKFQQIILEYVGRGSSRRVT